MRPKLDLRNSIWFTGLAERSAGDALDRWVGPSTDVQLEFERPFGNNEARGRYAQRQAEARQRQIDAGRSAREIALNVLGVAESVALARARVTHAQDAVAAYEQTGTAEVERFRAGESTLIDVILTEAQQTDARLALVAAEQELNTLIARLRFESGTLIRVDRQLQARFIPGDLVSIPRTVPRR
jgi:outer membrane protein TolC